MPSSSCVPRLDVLRSTRCPVPSPLGMAARQGWLWGFLPADFDLSAVRSLMPACLHMRKSS
jgi:hypothetical protein